ncbi:MAG: hypothetical protein GWP35_08165 [Proteobacteria bacterium]|jgi:hypothetical protein|nr:hypothetical protein [Pseudomonadota bacterium]
MRPEPEDMPGTFAGLDRLSPKRFHVNLLFGVILCLFWAGCGGGDQSPLRQDPPEILKPQTRIVFSRPGESLEQVAHRIGFQLAVLENLNPELQEIELNSGTQVRCPIGQPGVRKVENGT